MGGTSSLPRAYLQHPAPWLTEGPSLSPLQLHPQCAPPTCHCTERMWFCICSTGPSLTNDPNSPTLGKPPGKPSQLLAASGVGPRDGIRDFTPGQAATAGAAAGTALGASGAEALERGRCAPTVGRQVARCYPHWTTQPAAPCSPFTGGSCSNCPQQRLSWGLEVVLQRNGGCCHANRAGSRNIELTNQESRHATGDGPMPGCRGGLLSPVGFCSSITQPEELSCSRPKPSPSTRHSSVHAAPRARSPPHRSLAPSHASSSRQLFTDTSTGWSPLLRWLRGSSHTGRRQTACQ